MHRAANGATRATRTTAGHSGQAFLNMNNERSVPNKESPQVAARSLSLGDEGFSTSPLSAGQEVMIVIRSGAQARQVQGTVQR